MKPPERAARLHPLLLARSSPRSFDPTHTVAEHQVLALLEAARSAPSTGNSQPSQFLPVTRGSSMHGELVTMLAPSSRVWAADASLIVLNFVRAGHDGVAHSEFADYDLGQAVAHMTVQAQAMALSTRQFRAFDLDRVSAWLSVDVDWRLRTMTAVGRSLGVPDVRERRDLGSPLATGACRGTS